MPARSSGIVSGRAMGDALSRGLAGRTIAVFDALGAPFWIDAAGFARAAPRAAPPARLSRWFAEAGAASSVAGARGPGTAFDAGPVRSGLRVGLGAPQGAHLSLAAAPAAAQARFGNAVLSAFASTGPGGEVGERRLEADMRGLALAWRPDGGRTGLRAGWIAETDSFLGSSADGAFGRLSSNLTFVGASRTFEAGAWRVGASAELGRATRDATGGIVADTGAPAFSTAFSLDAARALARGTLRLSLRQPLRIESGRVRLSLPVGRTPEGAVVRRPVAVDLEPSGREIDFGVDWTREVASDSVLRIGARLIGEPGHVADGNPEAVAFAGLRIGR